MSYTVLSLTVTCEKTQPTVDPRYRVFVDNVLDIVKPEHQQVLFSRIISKVENFESSLESNIRAETIAIQEREELILSAQEYIAEKKANLDRLNAIQKEYSRP